MSATSDQTAELASLWRWFADSVTTSYARVYHRVFETVAADPELLGLALEAPPEAHLPPALLAAVHYLILDGLDHPLAAVYPGASDADPGPLFRELCLERRAELLQILGRRRIQTNEVGRSALIGPALRWATAHAGEPLQLVDIGCSAGLNLLCDRYLLDYGAHGATGPADAAVRVDCRVVSGSPPIEAQLPRISRRVGIDLDPPDLRDPDDARWLMACVWPGTGRLERAEQAIRLGQSDPPEVVKGDAVAALPGVLDGLDGGPVCLVTTWSYAYLHVDERDRFVELLRREGARRRIVWIACDGPGVVDLVPATDDGRADHQHDRPSDVMTAVVFDGSEVDATLLAHVQSHGLELDWRAPPAGAGIRTPAACR